MTLARYMEHVVRPMSPDDRREDLLSWHALGLGILKATLPRDPRMCSGINKYAQPCTAWGCFQSPDGRRWCHAHRVHEAERR